MGIQILVQIPPFRLSIVGSSPFSGNPNSAIMDIFKAAREDREAEENAYAKLSNVEPLNETEAEEIKKVAKVSKIARSITCLPLHLTNEWM